MLDPNRIRENPDEVRASLAKRGMKESLADDFLATDEKWRMLQQSIGETRAELNRLSKERKVEQAKTVKLKIKELESALASVEPERDTLLTQFPNLLSSDVPVGKDDSANVVLKTIGDARASTGKDYLTLAQELDLIDIERAGKVSGSRFGYLKREAVLLEFALIKLAMDVLTKEGFIPVIPPVLIKPEMLMGMGKAKFIADGDAFHLPEDKLYLVGSSEHSIGPMHAGEIFDEKNLPRRYVGFSTCFRREAGSYGKDTRGILRVHQFDKVEMFSITTPEQSEEEHQFLLSQQERLMQMLKLPYRVVANCSGDTGFDTARQFDIETWLPGEGRYRETHSTSNTTDFQSRGVNIKYRKTDGTTEFVHMLNGTAFSQRPIIAILENCQQPDGSVRVPDVLVPYTGFTEIALKIK